MTIQDKIDADYLLGIVLYKGVYRFYLNPIAWWILDYAAYDPSILEDSERTSGFRDGIITVNVNTAETFINSISADEISVAELKDAVGDGQLQPYFLVDFDNTTMTSYFYDIEVESYVPTGWKGVFANPIDSLPDYLRSI